MRMPDDPGYGEPRDDDMSFGDWLAVALIFVVLSAAVAAGLIIFLVLSLDGARPFGG